MRRAICGLTTAGLLILVLSFGGCPPMEPPVNGNGNSNANVNGNGNVNGGGNANGNSNGGGNANNNDNDNGSGRPAPPLSPSPDFPLIELPAGFAIEKLADGLTYATSLAWDDDGRLYVLEAGGAFVEEPVPARLLRVDAGSLRQVLNLGSLGLADAVVGLAWHDGAFLLTHRDPDDRSGAVSRVTLGGDVTRLISGLVDSQSEHQVNDIRVGPDGRVYFAAGPASNSGVVGIDLAPFVARSPTVRATPAQDIVLTGVNFLTPDFRTDDQSDTTLTGAFVPFGTATEPGQVIQGSEKPGGAILSFDLDDPEGSLTTVAWGLRNVIGLAWDGDGALFAAVNGYDVRGSRPINDRFDATYRIRTGAWYGWPDFSAALLPVTADAFDVPSSLKAAVFIGDELQPDKEIRFLIDHEASGLSAPDPDLVFGTHEVNSSPSLCDFAPDSWGDFAGFLIVAEWGDLAPGTTPLRPAPAGFRIVAIDPNGGSAVPIAQNVRRGPASALGEPGMGLERPFGVRFGPDGALYIVDFGIARVNQAAAAEGRPPYDFPRETGAVWRISPE